MFEKLPKGPKMRGPRFDKQANLRGLIIRSAEGVKFSQSSIPFPGFPPHPDSTQSGVISEETESDKSIYDKYPDLLKKPVEDVLLQANSIEPQVNK